MSKLTISVLLIEDEKHIRRFIRSELESRDMTVHEAATGRDGLIAAKTRRPDLLIVDLGLPDMDGLDVIRQIRGWTDVPLIVLSARSREEEKVGAFEAGADDYLTKPFGTGELIARIHALLWRTNRHAENRSDDGRDVRLGGIRVDFTHRLVTLNGEAVHLTPVEFRLFATMIREAGRVLTHQQLLTQVWGPSHAEDTQYLRVYMGNLRHKLENDPAQPVHFVTETGVGYRLVGLERDA